MTKIKVEVEIPRGEYCYDQFSGNYCVFLRTPSTGIGQSSCACLNWAGLVKEEKTGYSHTIKHPLCPHGPPLRNYMIDVAFEIESRKEFEDLTKEEILAGLAKRVESLTKNWDPDAFGLCDEHEVNEERDE